MKECKLADSAWLRTTFGDIVVLADDGKSETMLGKKLGAFENNSIEKEAVLALGERVKEAQRVAGKEMRDLEDNKKGGRRGRGRNNKGGGQRGEDAEEK